MGIHVQEFNGHADTRRKHSRKDAVPVKAAIKSRAIVTGFTVVTVAVTLYTLGAPHSAGH